MNHFAPEKTVVGTHNNKASHKTVLIAAGIAGGVLLLGCCIATACHMHQKSRYEDSDSEEEEYVSPAAKKISEPKAPKAAEPKGGEDAEAKKRAEEEAAAAKQRAEEEAAKKLAEEEEAAKAQSAEAEGEA